MILEDVGDGAVGGDPHLRGFQDGCDVGTKKNVCFFHFGESDRGSRENKGPRLDERQDCGILEENGLLFDGVCGCQSGDSSLNSLILGCNGFLSQLFRFRNFPPKFNF